MQEWVKLQRQFLKVEASTLRTFTLRELAEYDGSDGNPAYVSYKGKVYDVTNGQNWTGGTHYEHYAGEDLTEEMDNAPHGDEVMDAFPVVGELIQ